MRLRVAFYKLANNELMIQFEHIDDRLRNRPDVLCRRAGITVHSQTMPEVQYPAGLFIPGDYRDRDHEPLHVRFRSPEMRDDYIRKVRMALTQYVRRHGGRLECSRDRGQVRSSVLAL